MRLRILFHITFLSICVKVVEQALSQTDTIEERTLRKQEVSYAQLCVIQF